MRYVTVDELVYINQQVLTGETIHSIVEGKRAVRDMGLLEAAAARPMASAFGEDAYITLGEKAAVLLHSLARNHPFADGNKRTAAVAALFMLAVNGQQVTWDDHEALTWIIAIAEGKQSPETFAEWLPTVSSDPTPEPDAERDTALLAQLIATHEWLLAELAGR
ncbi:MAG: type II toxin-antitoxin system death-on-curing family toxin [Anaerolineaceae bacterium]|nr:type II toxin-antitoxin system death-on-curing family toxin [Anaerolineaceae bacterium]